MLAGVASVTVNNPAGATPEPTTCAALTAAGNANTNRAYKNSSPSTPNQAIINQPVSCLDDAPDGSTWATRWFNYGRKDLFANPSDPALQHKRGEIIVSFREYSSPIYDAAEATGTRRIFNSHNYWDDGYVTVPWNPAWKPSANTDAEMIIVDKASGKEWGIWMQTIDPYYWFNGCNFQWGYDFHPEWGDLCVGSVKLSKQYVPGSSAPPNSDVRHNSSSDGFSPKAQRGMGAINGVALVPTFDEVKFAVDELKAGRRDNGYVHHALNMETYNTMFGNGLPPSGSTPQTNVSSGCSATDFADPTKAGFTCGYAVAPATRLEHTVAPTGATGMPNTDAARAKTVPEGTRFYLTISDAEIETWLAGRGLTPSNQKYWTAYVFARTLREYGWFISDTTAWTSSIAVDSSRATSKVADWATLGIDVLAAPTGSPSVESEYNLLEGLVTSSSQVGVVKVPDTGRCPTQTAFIGVPAALNKCTNAY